MKFPIPYPVLGMMLPRPATHTQVKNQSDEYVHFSEVQDFRKELKSSFLL